MPKEQPITASELDILLNQIARAWLDCNLDGRDEEFLLSMQASLRPGYQLSEKQRDWLNSIFRRTGVHWNPRGPLS